MPLKLEERIQIFSVHQMRVTMAGATFPTNFDTNISEVMNPEVIFFSTMEMF